LEPEPTPVRLAAYFLRLGALGFGGPVALVEAIRRDLVEIRSWLTEEEYELGLAIAAACPGPLAYQLGVYCGYVRFGTLGALSVAVAFGLVPFLLVTGAAALYTRYSGSAPVRGLFYGIGPVVLALVLKAAFRLGRKTLRRDVLASVIAAIACLVTVATEREITAVILLAGLAGSLLFGSSNESALSVPGAPPPSGPASGLVVAVPLTSGGLAAKLFLFFFKTGCLVFGSGLVIVPFLRATVVGEYGWLGDREFVDAVAIGMISPGPVVITATFVGYLVDGLAGAGAATAGIFAPAVLFTLVATPLLRRHGAHPRIRGLVRGVTASVVGVLLGTVALIAPAVIPDATAAGIAVGAVGILVSTKRCPDLALIAAGGLLGVLLSPAVAVVAIAR
jgi:chromate transporter